MATSGTEKLRRLLGVFSREDRLLIVINADPDALASAMALKRLLWRQVSSATIAHVNVIKRPDNLAMIRLLKLDIVPRQNVDISQFTRFALLDSQPPHHEGFAGINFDVVIDHHPATGTKATFVDVRPEIGANSTIMTHYLRAAKIKPSTRLATALFYGIKTDTSNFERKALPEDMKAFQFLFHYVNVQVARRIEQAEITLDMLKYFKKALDEMTVKKNRIHVHLGAVANPDVCVSIADFFMKVHDVAWTIVSGVYRGRLVIIVRNDGAQKDAGEVVKTAFGELGSAGGHKAMARAEIPLESLQEKLEGRDDKGVSRWVVSALDLGKV